MVFIGKFQNDTMHGEGLMKYADGDVYAGMWANGERHGRGVLSNPKTNKEQEGIWKNGELMYRF